MKNEQKILTLHGERGAYTFNKDEQDWNDIASITRGYESMNDCIRIRFRDASVQSVSISNVIFPDNAGYWHMWLYATIVYTGEVRLSSESDKEDLANNNSIRVSL